MNIYQVELSEIDADDAVWLTATGVAESAMSAGQLVLDTELESLDALQPALEVRSVYMLASCEFIENSDS